MAPYVDRCWNLLGIESTSDQRAIRTAYSTKLKAIDPELDPQAFIALRDAFEAARADAWEMENAATLQPEPAPAGPVWEPAQPEADDPDPVDEVAVHADAIAELLYNHSPGADYFDDAATAELLGHWRAIATDPRLEDVTLFDRVEQWAGSIILDTAPRSDALQFIEAAQQPGHSHHAEWVELNTPAGAESKRGTVGPHKLYELFDTISWSRPDLRWQLDPQRVALWKRKENFEASYDAQPVSSEPSRVPWISLALFFMWLTFGMTRSCSQENNRPQPLPVRYEAPAPMMTPQTSQTPTFPKLQPRMVPVAPPAPPPERLEPFSGPERP